MKRSSLMAVVILAVVGCSQAAPPGAMTAPLNAQQYAAEIEQAKQRTPLPPGVGWQDPPIDPNASYGVYAGASIIEFQAMCRWFVEARAASGAEYQPRLTRANDVIRKIPTWRSFSDPALNGVEFRALIQQTVQAVLVGDYASAAQFIQANCLLPN